VASGKAFATDRVENPDERSVSSLTGFTFQEGSTLLTNRYDEALAFAHKLHRSQTRKGTNIPYISHLLSVSALVIEHGGTEDQAIAALLHDGPEDQGGEATLTRIREMFGDPVAAIVSDCTDSWVEPKPPWRARKEAYLAKLGAKPKTSLLVSLADKTHNAEAILFDYRDIGDELWSRFNGGREGTQWYYQSLSDIFHESMPGRLAERFASAVVGFSGHVARGPDAHVS
jgi:(p)ppGpp synthase/HD superfamily hydrolase